MNVCRDDVDARIDPTKARALALASLLAAAACNREPSSRDGDAALRDAADVVHEQCHDKQCLIPAGTFMMGSPPDEPNRGRFSEELHEVTLTHDILYDQYETTQSEWLAAGFPNLAGTKRNSAGGIDCTDPTCPASVLTWYEAANFANWRSRAEQRPECFNLIDCRGDVGIDFECSDVKATTSSYYECRGYRLPTMDEFQYAARAGTSTTFYSGPLETDSNLCVPIDHLTQIAWYCANSNNMTHPVGQRQPNSFGLYDMLGNAFEYAGSRPDNDTRTIGAVVDPNPKFSSDSTFAMAGCSFFCPPAFLRVASQGSALSVTALPREAMLGAGGGFRLVRSISREEAERWKH